MQTWFRWRHRVLLVAGACLAFWQLQVHASNAILIWPLDPVIEDTAPGAAIWVENRGKQVATMQLRVVAWAQVDGEDEHRPQTDIIGTPAIFRIDPGKRQLVRLTRTQAPPPGAEWAYRVLIDEIPGVPGSDVAASAQSRPFKSGLRFQLRYSIPLFSYGAGLASLKNGTDQAHRLQWQQGGEGHRRWVDIRNPGPLHAKLVDIGVRGQDGQVIEATNGHLGYVLADSTGRWRLPDAATRVMSVHAGINGSASQPLEQEMP